MQTSTRPSFCVVPSNSLTLVSLHSETIVIMVYIYCNKESEIIAYSFDMSLQHVVSNICCLSHGDSFEDVAHFQDIQITGHGVIVHHKNISLQQRHL